MVGTRVGRRSVSRRSKTSLRQSARSSRRARLLVRTKITSVPNTRTEHISEGGTLLETTHKREASRADARETLTFDSGASVLPRGRLKGEGIRRRREAHPVRNEGQQTQDPQHPPPSIVRHVPIAARPRTDRRRRRGVRRATRTCSTYSSPPRAGDALRRTRRHTQSRRAHTATANRPHLLTAGPISQRHTHPHHGRYQATARLRNQDHVIPRHSSSRTTHETR